MSAIEWKAENSCFLPWPYGSTSLRENPSGHQALSFSFVFFGEITRIPLPSVWSSFLPSILSFPFCIYLFLWIISIFFILINLLVLYCRIVEPTNCWLHEDQVSVMVKPVSLLWSTSFYIDSFLFLGLIPYLSSCCYFFFFLAVDSHLLAMEAQRLMQSKWKR